MNSFEKVIAAQKLESRFIAVYRLKGITFDDIREMGKTKDLKTKILAKLDRKRDEFERKAMDALIKTGIAKEL